MMYILIFLFQKERLREVQLCKPCVNWKFESAETWGLRFDITEGLFIIFIEYLTNYLIRFLFGLIIRREIKAVQTGINVFCCVGTHQRFYSF